MTRKIAFWIFIVGTAISAGLFLFLTFDTHRQVSALSHADKLSGDVVAGKRVFEKYNCNDCHTILGFGGYYAPDLTKVFKRIGEDGIRYRISDPHKAFADSVRKMPRQAVSGAEIANLIAFFKWVGEIQNGDWPPQDSKNQMTRSEERMVAGVGVSAGASVFKSRGCMNCHSLDGEGGTSGPALDHAGQKMSMEQIGHYIVNPKDMNPAAMMPPQGDLSEKELDEVAKFLASLK